MARPLRVEYAGAFYHIVDRGNERKAIFRTKKDREEFLEYVKVMCYRYAAQVHSYCLMRNHYHLVLETKEANLSRAMHDLNTSYTVYYNRRRKRSGHLFQGRYKAILVEADEYLHHLSRYIHLNPVRAKIVKDPEEYTWSSYRHFLSKKVTAPWLNTRFILSMLSKDEKKGRRAYKKFVRDGMGDAGGTIKKNITSGFILGGEEFVEWVKEEFIDKMLDKEIPDIKRLKHRPHIEHIADRVREVVRDKELMRTISIYLARKHTGHTLKEIAEFYGGIGDAGVSLLHKRMEKRRQKDTALNKLIATAEKKMLSHGKVVKN